LPITIHLPLRGQHRHCLIKIKRTSFPVSP
jgi:hypothetical protein